MISLIVKYDGGLNAHIENAIIRIIGFEPANSGQWVGEPQTRDMQFEFGEDLAGAERAKAYVTDVPGVRVKFYDDSLKEKAQEASE